MRRTGLRGATPSRSYLDIGTAGPALPDDSAADGSEAAVNLPGPLAEAPLLGDQETVDLERDVGAVAERPDVYLAARIGGCGVPTGRPAAGHDNLAGVEEERLGARVEGVGHVGLIRGQTRLGRVEVHDQIAVSVVAHVFPVRRSLADELGGRRTCRMSGRRGEQSCSNRNTDHADAPPVDDTSHHIPPGG